MRTGLGHPCDAPRLPAGVDDVARRMMALTVSMVSRAGENAAVYAEHAGRKDVVPKDVHRALQYQAKTFLGTVTDDEVQDALEDVTKACEEDFSDDDSEEAFDDESDLETDEEDADPAHDGDEVWTPSACTCDICAGMNEAHDTWDTYAPEDEALAYLKSLTDNFLQTHQ